MAHGFSLHHPADFNARRHLSVGTKYPPTTTLSASKDSAASKEDSTRTAVEHDETEALGVRKIAKWSSITDDVQRIRTVRARAPRILVQRRRGEEAETRRESAEPVVRRHG